MYYRIINYDYVPYAIGYNYTDLKLLGSELYERDKLYFDTEKITKEDIIKALEEGDRDIAGYYVEQDEKPFDEKLLDY